jgi:hypothetical protein
VQRPADRIWTHRSDTAPESRRVAQPPVEDEHRAREPSGEQLVILHAAIRMASAQRNERGSGEEREDHGDGNGHGSVIGECLLPL